MDIYYEGQVLWAQIDANQHMRHTAYADFAAQARLAMLESLGLKPSMLYGFKIGPVLFREELIYLREVGINEYIKVTCDIVKARADGSRWTIRHELYRGDGVKAAIIEADGAWIDMEKRKLITLPPELSELFMRAPKSNDYIEEPGKQQ
ncbi:thioesterase family protein [Mucilaginibacter sp. BJC16-A38]|uniref:acyl-CoA thioesterase n=1 Tax=Mucilaginibacter phenanthrenivorans TaxID=1234842 RepID=UPI0021575DC0|nr:acyl-CoA thioesterase [Mucilaginibacter phenanthrenivorans]MCR8556244.1 thioesterase family protein [Mucilaginibacter phenanthrenivorans]MDP9078554.1 thioesterase family protein [Bacteroidota bacterium]